MKCPECGSNIVNRCCLNCGFMTNGSHINTNDCEDKLINQKLYNKQFDTMNRNQNSFFPFLFGGLYISYHGHIFVGLLFMLIETCLFKVLDILIHCFVVLYLYRLALYMLFILVSRLLIAAVSNGVCLYLDNYKINKIIKKYPKNYKEKLFNHYNFGMVKVLITIVLYILLYILLFTSIIK